ncbi:MAG: hypothetical protein HY791_23710 [Deltaproteobacteria bacterium]|nr:hypothetical protein [Deltaproteobacteria bacterium]
MPQQVTTKQFPHEPFGVQVCCLRCEATFEQKVDQVFVEGEFGKRVVFDRITVCPKCGVADEFRVTGFGSTTLVAAMLADAAEARELAQKRVLPALPHLWDGTTVESPTRALEHLREHTETVGSGESWRRLGNYLDRLDRTDEACDAWRRAVAVDERECEAAASLANSAFRYGRFQEGIDTVQELLRRFPECPGPQRATVSHFAAAIICQIDSDVRPIALDATWHDGEVNGQAIVRASSVAISDVASFEDLAKFLEREGLLALRLTDELPEEDTQLSALLSGDLDERPPIRVAAAPSAPSKKQRAEKKRKRKLQELSRKKNRRK